MKSIICVIGIIIIAIFTLFQEDVRAYNNSDKFLDVEQFSFPQDCIIKTYNAPTSLYIAEWAKSNNIRAVGYVSTFGSDFVNQNKYKQIRDDILKNYNGPDILVFKEYGNHPNHPNPLRYGITQLAKKEIEEKKLYCREIKSNLEPKAKICVPQELKKQILGDD